MSSLYRPVKTLFKKSKQQYTINEISKQKSKLHRKIELCLECVSESVTNFEEIWEKLQSSGPANVQNRGKYLLALKKEIKRLHNLRGEIKSWIALGDKESHDRLIQAKKVIESSLACSTKGTVEEANVNHNSSSSRMGKILRGTANILKEKIAHRFFVKPNLKGLTIADCKSDNLDTEVTHQSPDEAQGSDNQTFHTHPVSGEELKKSLECETETSDQIALTIKSSVDEATPNRLTGFSHNKLCATAEDTSLLSCTSTSDQCDPNRVTRQTIRSSLVTLRRNLHHQKRRFQNEIQLVAVRHKGKLDQSNRAYVRQFKQRKESHKFYLRTLDTLVVKLDTLDNSDSFLNQVRDFKDKLGDYLKLCHESPAPAPAIDNNNGRDSQDLFLGSLPNPESQGQIGPTTGSLVLEMTLSVPCPFPMDGHQCRTELYPKYMENSSTGQQSSSSFPNSNFVAASNASSLAVVVKNSSDIKNQYSQDNNKGHASDLLDQQYWSYSKPNNVSINMGDNKANNETGGGVSSTITSSDFAAAASGIQNLSNSTLELEKLEHQKVVQKRIEEIKNSPQILALASHESRKARIFKRRSATPQDAQFLLGRRKLIERRDSRNPRSYNRTRFGQMSPLNENEPQIVLPTPTTVHLPLLAPPFTFNL